VDNAGILLAISPLSSYSTPSKSLSAAASASEHMETEEVVDIYVIEAVV
jgi:hypothetical protein